MTQITVERARLGMVRINGLADVDGVLAAIAELDEDGRDALRLLLAALADLDGAGGSVSPHDGQRYSPARTLAERRVDAQMSDVRFALESSMHVTVGRGQARQLAADLDEVLGARRSAA